MKEFFTNGIHGHTWEPDNMNCAIEALTLTMKCREEMSAECRRNALNHSWTCSGRQIEAIYSEIVGLKKKKAENSGGLVAVVGRLVFYLTQWFFLMLLIVFFLLPFLKVYKPQEATVGQESCESTNKKRRKSAAAATSSVNEPERQHTIIYSFLKNQKNNLESSCNRVMLAGTCIFLSLAIFYSTVL